MKRHKKEAICQRGNTKTPAKPEETQKTNNPKKTIVIRNEEE